MNMAELNYQEDIEDNIYQSKQQDEKSPIHVKGNGIEDEFREVDLDIDSPLHYRNGPKC